ncbi:hypothetical protein Cob_v010202 [Colletotrichum orbiculare MAFF 240422]|uniref:Uncharacterized protein n=1 Tax=Colletotrichum orbiculare (strain 104-T / ATCC 96160 / CBS 514.97 / LARS 414 / MAFF 240422) TaxID=1213857 RepID=A0A484FIF9_COLOR|nr:hypothetical protein Cob_v010202 [Colletotrichum orbiculare MAFF 240422]
MLVSIPWAQFPNGLYISHSFPSSGLTVDWGSTVSRSRQDVLRRSQSLPPPVPISKRRCSNIAPDGFLSLDPAVCRWHESWWIPTSELCDVIVVRIGPAFSPSTL